MDGIWNTHYWGRPITKIPSPICDSSPRGSCLIQKHGIVHTCIQQEKTWVHYCWRNGGVQLAGTAIHRSHRYIVIGSDYRILNYGRLRCGSSTPCISRKSIWCSEQYRRIANAILNVNNRRTARSCYIGISKMPSQIAVVSSKFYCNLLP